MEKHPNRVEPMQRHILSGFGLVVGSPVIGQPTVAVVS
jgi:hypothetical protein